MKHLIICRGFPPAPGGGIGTYAANLARLLVERGETVHIIAQLWEGAEKDKEESFNGHLIIHRVPYLDWTSLFRSKPCPTIRSEKAKDLFYSDFPAQCFAWQAGLLAERLVEQEGIDIIEAQDYEAPLYFFQFRRALGAGPKRRPPCIVHLHSPSRYIALYNNWDPSLPEVIKANQLEDYSIKAADALLCPSRYLAKQVQSQYNFTDDVIRVIPYPIGDSPIIERSESTWKNGTICYMGRLEPRKGLLEWVDEAVAVANECKTAHFEFVGADTVDPQNISFEGLLRRRIPRKLKKRFNFVGTQKHSLLSKYLTKARIAVVPSRWENFPNSCIEAMSSGIPVIASREGGMVEMVKDGRSGWLARRNRSDGLSEALRRALKTPPEKLFKMGQNASRDIRRLCNNDRILEHQIDFRNEIISQGSKLFVHLSEEFGFEKKPNSSELTSLKVNLHHDNNMFHAKPDNKLNSRNMLLYSVEASRRFFWRPGKNMLTFLCRVKNKLLRIVHFGFTI